MNIGEFISKRIFLIIYILFTFNCQLSDSKIYISVNEAIKDYLIEYGDPISIDDSVFYDDGDVKIKIITWSGKWDSDCILIEDYNRMSVLIWNNRDLMRSDVYYGWNFLSGPYYSNNN